MRSLLLLLALGLLGLSTGCATMISNEIQEVRLQVSPPDAAITVDKKPVTPTGGTLKVSRAAPHELEISKEGFETRHLVLKQGLNPWFFGNFGWLGFFWVGMIVDAVNGQMYELEPAVLTVALDPLDPKTGRPTVERPAEDPVKRASTTPQSLQPSGPAISDPMMQPGGPTFSETSGTAAGGPLSRPKVAHTQINAAQRAWVVAVMNTTSTNKLDKALLLALGDQLRVYLAERGAKVVDRSTQDNALKGLVEEEKKKSYAACVDSTCQIPLGKALAASHILRSSIAKFGKACATNGELIDLKAEVTVAAASARSDCSEEGLLWAAESLAEQLVAGSARAKP